MTEEQLKPEHHDPQGGFRNPWPRATPPFFTGILRWAVTRCVKPRIDRTPRGSFPTAKPDCHRPRAAATDVSLTWIGHATFLLQIGGLNILTDPVWSERCAPVRFAGPRRYMAPGISFEDLPPIDLVVLSHDHYDHLDSEAVRRIASDHPDARWLVPLGLLAFIEQIGARGIAELDWWAEFVLDDLVVTCVPAQHFSGRGTKRNGSLWCGWVVASATRRLYFVGDTGRHSSFTEIGARLGPFDTIMMPIGAYDPRWLMAPVHVNPEEAVKSFLELTAGSDRDCSMTAMHWGTFKLTDEPMTEPPIRTNAAWEQAGLDPRHLWIMSHGETRWLEANGDSPH